MRRFAIIGAVLVGIAGLTAGLLALLNEGATTFEVDGDTLRVSGVLTLLSTERIDVLAEQHPEITTLVLGEIDPASDPDAMMEKAALLRVLGLNTRVADGVALDPDAILFYLGGVERSLGTGASLTVSDWQTSVGPASALVADHPAHSARRGLIDTMLGAPEFYDFSIAAAPVGGAYRLTAEDLAAFGITTQTE